MRSRAERLEWYASHAPRERGLCGEHAMRALAVPRQGLPDAVALLDAVPRSELYRDDAPKGALVYWRGGSQGHGHVCFAMGDHVELSVDVNPRRSLPAERPFPWFADNWPRLRYAGWSWYFGAICTRHQR